MSKEQRTLSRLLGLFPWRPAGDEWQRMKFHSPNLGISIHIFLWHRRLAAEDFGMFAAGEKVEHLTVDYQEYYIFSSGGIPKWFVKESTNWHTGRGPHRKKSFHVFNVISLNVYQLLPKKLVDKPKFWRSQFALKQVTLKSTKKRSLGKNLV